MEQSQHLIETVAKNHSCASQQGKPKEDPLPEKNTPKDFMTKRHTLQLNALKTNDHSDTSKRWTRK